MVSLLRWMIASEDAKNPLKARKQLGSTRIWPCYIRLEEGDCLVESGEFAETQVQHPPDQMEKTRVWGFCSVVESILGHMSDCVGQIPFHTVL